ncbi:SpoIIE family protein phosphatase [Nocardia sp. NPDC050406]|uniref:SpoIIE family protein phosphatase n=1 Tax=Nocardia sp. NPDC050406 TaxID=3364318 RepID=UPI0037B43BD8
MHSPASSGPALPSDLRLATALGGEMGRRFAEFDWATHPLGPPSGWPSELRASVAVALTSRFPIILWLGARELFLVYNDAYIPILGDKHPAALGRTGRDVWWDVWASIEPMLRSVVETGAATWSDDLMLPLVTGNRPQERYFTFSYSPLIAVDGVVGGVFCAVTETTERVLGERRLHALNAVAAAVMETRTVVDAVCTTVAVCARHPADLPFVAVYVEDAGAQEITLRGATERVLPLLPATLSELTAWTPARDSRTDSHEIDDLASVIPGLPTVFDEDCPERALLLPLGPESARGVLVIATSPRRPLDQQYRGFCRLLADQLSSAFAAAVSYEQQRRRADELAELDRAKTAFLTNVSHEFRTPLTLLLGPVDDALAAADGDALLTDRLRTARRNAGRLLRLVDSLLDFSRIESGRATARLERADVGALTADIASSFTELCERAGLVLVLDCHAVAAEVDAAMWETVVLNLLSNAVKYTFHGEIRVQVRAENTDQCRITVRDTGIGIARGEVGRLFDRFYRAENARARSVEGTGIGLSLVRGLVELHRGTVDIDSEPGLGTTVTIRLPRSTENPPAERVHPRTGADNPYVAEAGQWLGVEPGGDHLTAGRDVNSRAGELVSLGARTETGGHSPALAVEKSGARLPDTIQRPRRDGGARRELVLIADDNADMRRHLDRVLSAHWDTVLVGDGESALRAVRKHRPDAVVTDVMMPGLDGFAFVAAVRADPELAATPVIMLSARAGRESASAGFAGGADDYIPKPFTSRDLVDRVAARLAAAARERAGRLRVDGGARRAAALSELEFALHSTDTVGSILAALLETAPAAASGAVIAVLDGETDCIRVEYAGDIADRPTGRPQVLALDAPTPIVDVIRTGRLVVVNAADGTGADVLGGAGDSRASVTYPLRDDADRVIGALALLWSHPRTFDAVDLEVLAAVAEVARRALGRVRTLAREHRIAVEFQEQLLDLDRRSTAAVVGAVYQPAGEAMRVGGDWYLAVPLREPNRLGISVGDVVGHGLPAAVAMSKLRSGLASGALTAADPAAVLETVDHFATAVPGSRCATLVYAVVDTPARTLEYSCAGHPYPLLLTPDGQAAFLTGGRRPPVAVPNAGSRGAFGRADIPPGSVVLLYTDGLIERPGESLDIGFERLRTTFAECAHLPVGEICTELLRRLAPPDGYSDDVAVLAVRPVHATARGFAIVLPATPARVTEARNRLRRWLIDHDIAPDRGYDILLAVGEALANAIEHGGHSDGRSTVSIEAFRVRDSVVATVSDPGTWSPDPTTPALDGELRGRGYTLMHGLADHVDTLRTPHGTRVTLRFEHTD